MKILVTGAAGFIGFHTSKKLCELKYTVIGIDNLNDYYDINLKKYRLKILKKYKNFKFYKGDILKEKNLKEVFKNKIDIVIHLAGMAGIRYSIENPQLYYSVNIMGTIKILQEMKNKKIKKIIFSSTSSLYASNKIPFSEKMKTHGLSPYSKSKKTVEDLLKIYRNLYDIDVCIFRFFTVYGEAGRPDMSVYKFIEGIKNNKQIEIYGNGKQTRDFTYIDDVINGIIKGFKIKGYEIFNLGNNKNITINELIKKIEIKLNKKAKIEYKSFHDSDMFNTKANIKKAKKILNWYSKININEGLDKTIKWHLRED